MTYKLLPDVFKPVLGTPEDELVHQVFAFLKVEIDDGDAS